MVKAKKREPSPQRTVRIFIVDDHPSVRFGLSHAIEMEPDMEVCGESDCIADALQLIEAAQPDLALVDISLKDGSGLELVKQLRARGDSVQVLVASMHDEKVYAERALRAGARGYINKAEVMDKTIEAIRQVLAGQVYVSETMASRFLHRIAGGQDEAQSPIDSLSDRELEVFELLGKGMSTRDIAERLHLSVKTIEKYRENIKAKLVLKNSLDLIRHAMEWVREQA